MNSPNEKDEDQDALAIQLLLAEYDQVWDSVQFWANELNKLVHWKLLLLAAAIAAYSTKEIVLLGVCCSAPAFWLLLTKRASYYYKLNLNRKSQVESALKKISNHPSVFEITEIEPLPFSISLFQSNFVAEVWTAISLIVVSILFVSQIAKGELTTNPIIAVAFAALGLCAFLLLVFKDNFWQ